MVSVSGAVITISFPPSLGGTWAVAAEPLPLLGAEDDAEFELAFLRKRFRPIYVFPRKVCFGSQSPQNANRHVNPKPGGFHAKW
jgi:hypothetical protein